MKRQNPTAKGRIWARIGVLQLAPTMRLFFVLALFSSCTPASPWKLDAISTQEKAFDATRLSFQSSESPLRFELLQVGKETFSFLSLTKFHFTPTTTDPPSLFVRFSLEEQSFEEQIPLLQGNMRLRISPETTSLLIRALQEGKKIAILVDGWEETLLPDRFETLYKKGAFSLSQVVKKPL